MRISVEVTDAERKKLEEAAQRLRVPVEELASAAVRDLLTPGDTEFERVAARVL